MKFYFNISFEKKKNEKKLFAEINWSHRLASLPAIAYYIKIY